MNKLIVNVLCLSFLFNISAGELGGKIIKESWNGVDVVYLPDNRFPTYNLAIYFADGALSDKRTKGLTPLMFDLLKAGTRRFSQKDIADNLEFFGVGHGARVTHEYSVYSVSGLVKDMVPTMKKICHLFQDASFPKSELKKEKIRSRTALQALINNHGALASRAFREISLRGTPYSYPTEGKLKDIKKWSQKSLKKKLNYFNEKVKKRIYVTGPSDIYQLKAILKNECGWNGQGHFVRSEKVTPKKRTKVQYVLVTVPKANQAQVRVGRFLAKNEIGNSEVFDTSSRYLGGGFTGQLMQELRVKRGLTYGVSASAGGQKDYGRAVITTSTKNEKVNELIEVTKKVLEESGRGKILPKFFERSKSSLAGGYPFGFEESSAYLSQLMFLDHIGKSYNELFNFPEKVRALKLEEVAKNIKKIFGWNSQTVVVLGSIELKKELQKLGPVTIVNYKSYL